MFHDFLKGRLFQIWLFKKGIIIFKFTFPPSSLFLFWFRRVLSRPLFSSFRCIYFLNILYHYNTNFLFWIFNIAGWIWAFRVNIRHFIIIKIFIICITIFFKIILNFSLLFSLIMNFCLNIFWFWIRLRILIFKILTFVFFGTITPGNWRLPVAFNIISILMSNINWGKHLVFF